MLLFYKERKSTDSGPKYQDGFAKLIGDRSAIESVLPHIGDQDLYLVYQEKLVNINKEIGLLCRRAKETNERNDNWYANATVNKQHQEIIDEEDGVNSKGRRTSYRCG